MSIRVLNEVFDHSTARGSTFCVLVALADAASHDGVCWLPIEAELPKRSITGRAHCSKREAFRAIRWLEELGELEVVKVRRASSFVNVYRVKVGAIAEVAVDYERLPFELAVPFGEGVRLAPSRVAASATGAATRRTGTANVEGANDAPSNEAVRVPDPAGSGCQDRAVQGAKSVSVKVPGSRAREEELEPSGEAAAGTVPEPKPEDLSSSAAAEAPLRDADVQAVVERLPGADAGSMREIGKLTEGLPRGVFFAAVEKLDRRIAAGTVREPCALLTKLLRVARAERAAQISAQLAAELGQNAHRYVQSPWAIDALKRDQPERFTRLMAKSLTPAEMREALAEHRDVEDFVELAEAIRAGREPGEERLGSPLEESRRWLAQHHDDPDVDGLIDAWSGLDEVDRQQLHELADELREQAHAAGEADEQAA